jgi:hypothetical protein
MKSATNHLPTPPRLAGTFVFAVEGAMVAGQRLGPAPRLAAVIGAAACFGRRIPNVAQHWNLPKATGYHW